MMDRKEIRMFEDKGIGEEKIVGDDAWSSIFSYGIYNENSLGFSWCRRA